MSPCLAIVNQHYMRQRLLLGALRMLRFEYDGEFRVHECLIIKMRTVICGSWLAAAAASNAGFRRAPSRLHWCWDPVGRSLSGCTRYCLRLPPPGRSCLAGLPWYAPPSPTACAAAIPHGPPQRASRADGVLRVGDVV